MKVCDKRNHEIHQIHKSGVLKSLFSCVSCISWFVMICAALSAYAGAVEATSPVFGLSLKHDGVRQSAGAETLTYSSQWDGGEGATVTIAQNGVAIAEGLSGEGERAWAVQQTGEYTLTHTTYTNGVAGKVETATFVVPGPELTVEYDGGPFVGGKVTINGNIDGWTIYYTLDGSTPTTESLKYTGPFTLSAAAVLKVFAVSPSGMSTPIVENNYAVVERARIENVRARQRLPWNGKVDIDFDVVGSAGVPYGVVLSVEDTVGGTNLLMQTVVINEGVAINPSGAKVTPGEYRWTWDAAADLPDGFECEAVSVNVDVLGEGAFAYFVRFNANGGEGTMNDEMFVYGVEKALPANAFTRKGYAFAGWATSSDGEKVYEDKDNILNLATTSGTVIALYAVWKDNRAKVQLWEGGPYWATMNIGAENPWDYGYYFWWGDTIGYKRVNDCWVASDGSSTNFSFDGFTALTLYEQYTELVSKAWIDGQKIVLMPNYDAANKHLGDSWRMPTHEEQLDLIRKCERILVETNGVRGVVFRGKGDFACNSVFFPLAGQGCQTFLNFNNYSCYWSSQPASTYPSSMYYSWALEVGYDCNAPSHNRDSGYPIRPVQSPTK